MVFENKREIVEPTHKKYLMNDIKCLKKMRNIQNCKKIQAITKKSNYEFKKRQQIQRLNKINTEREMKSQRVLEKLSKCSSVFTLRSTRASENYNEKLKNIQYGFKLKELEYDTYLKNSNEKSSKNEQRVNQIIAEKLKSKSEIAKSMAKSLVDRKEHIENEILSNKIDKLLQKTKKIKKFKSFRINELKRKIDKKRFNIEAISQTVKLNLIEEDKKFNNKIGSCIARMHSKNLSDVTSNSERHKEKLIRNELQRLQANTRISRNKFEFVFFT